MQVVWMAPVEVRDKKDSMRSIGHLHELSTILELETRVSQAACYRYVMNNMYYWAGYENIYEASEAYFNLPLDQLSYDQEITLIAILSGPAVFSLTNRPERLAKEVTRLKGMVERNKE